MPPRAISSKKQVIAEALALQAVGFLGRQQRVEELFAFAQESERVGAAREPPQVVRERRLLARLSSQDEIQVDHLRGGFRVGGDGRVTFQAGFEGHRVGLRPKSALFGEERIQLQPAGVGFVRSRPLGVRG
jgi:hypothetical protein